MLQRRGLLVRLLATPAVVRAPRSPMSARRMSRSLEPRYFQAISIVGNPVTTLGGTEWVRSGVPASPRAGDVVLLDGREFRITAVGPVPSST